MLDRDAFTVNTEQLRWRCPPESLGFQHLSELAETRGIIGQDRALEAIRLGVSIRSKGHNVFVSGPAGSGRGASVRHLLESLESGRGAPPDLIYVHNFRDPDRPLAIALPAGEGAHLRREMDGFVRSMRRGLAQLYESGAYERRTQEVVQTYETRGREAIREFESRIKAEGFALVQVQVGPFTKPDLAPLVAGEPASMEKLETLVEEGKFDQAEVERLRTRYMELRAYLEQTFRRSRDLKRELRDELTMVEREYGQPIVNEAIAEIEAKFSEARVAAFLDQVREAVLADMHRFLDKENEEGEPAERRPPEEDARYRFFRVNLLVDHTGSGRPPVVFETSPNFRNLFGAVEKVVDRSGHYASDFLHIKAGSLHRANGGFLVLDLLDAANEPGVWPALKRTLRNQQIEIQAHDAFALFAVNALQPEPIPLDLRVVVLGDGYLYHWLYASDPDFRKIFKVKAEFDTQMVRDREGIQRYVGFVRSVVGAEGLTWPDPSGVARIIEHGARLAGQAERLSTRFSDLADLLREASYWAERMELKAITSVVVQRAIEEREQRLRLPEEKIQEMIEDGTIRIETTGAVVGQVNGLSVFDLGDHRFGKPTRITAQSSLGQGGILSIEREAELSGRTFNKAMLILDGFFRARFGQDFPLSANASIAFEQSYGEVDGDSASVAEIVALLSSLSDLPVQQALAVTGSADQRGQVQAIGGVNEKIEGFFGVCRSRGWQGGEAVVIPSANVRDLMLRDDVVEAVRDGLFRVYAVERVEQAVELLLGVPAGNRLEDGLWEENTVFGRVQDRLHYYAERMKEFGKTDLPPHESPETDVAVPGSPELPPATERTRFSRPAWR